MAEVHVGKRRLVSVINEAVTGTTTSTTAGKLVDTGASFDSTYLNRGVIDSTGNYATITAVDSSTTLSISPDIMTSPEAYTIPFFGTAKAATKWVGLDCMVTETYKPNLIDIHGAGTDTLNVEDRVMGKKEIGVSFDYIPQDAKLLQFIASTITEAGASPYTHTFNFLKTISSFSAEVADRHTTDFVREYDGCYVENWEINFSEGEPVKVRLDCGAQDVVKDTTVQTVTAATLAPFMFHNAKWTYEGAAGTGVAAVVKSGTIRGINKMTKPFYCAQVTGNKVSEPILEEQFFELDVTLQVLDSSFFDTLIVDPLAKVSGTNTIEFIKDATDDKIVITLTDLWLSDYTITNSYEDTLTQDVKFKIKSIAFVATDLVENW